jgi:hypothetical protein
MSYTELPISSQTPILSWANHDLSPDETKMAQNVASLPFVFKHLALMPDVHLGKGALFPPRSGWILAVACVQSSCRSGPNSSTAN